MLKEQASGKTDSEKNKKLNMKKTGNENTENLKDRSEESTDEETEPERIFN